MSTKDEALFKLDASEVRAGQKWKHVKTDHLYTIVATGLAEATLTPVVIYTGHDGVVWVRDLGVFLGNNNEGKPRFILVTEFPVLETRDGVRGFYVSGMTPEALESAMAAYKAARS